MKKSLKSPGLTPLKGKNVAPKQMPKKMTNKSPAQFILKTGQKMLGKAMKKLSSKKK